jgi:hypothetical protein
MTRERSMPPRGLVLTEDTTPGLFFIQRYRFLTIDQFWPEASPSHRDQEFPITGWKAHPRKTAR